jgi:ABC-type antimicrobial peptide transport system permease subunit
MVFRQGARLAVIGLAAGWGIALVVGHTLSSLLYGVTPHNPSALCTVAALLSVVAALACWLPARRATKVDPVVALRAE